MKLQGRRAIVTGGAAGIGLGIATELAAEGAHVIIHDRDGEAAEAAVKKLRADGGNASAVKVDVTDRVAVRVALQEAFGSGRVDILVNNAGISVIKNALDITDEEWDAVVAVNLTATWTYSQTVGRHMVEQGGGSIVNIGSVASVLAHYQRAPYHATKGAVNLLTRALAMDLGDHGVRVNAVGPGAVEDTGIGANTGALAGDAAIAMTPLRRRGTSREVGRAVVYLCSDDAAFVTGHLLMVDGGMSIGTQIGSTWSPPTS
jgi:NAD(P)-dependent dehydrogenase (short-subunit alcohol dehydrogenase family)